MADLSFHTVADPEVTDYDVRLCALQVAVNIFPKITTRYVRRTNCDSSLTYRFTALATPFPAWACPTSKVT